MKRFLSVGCLVSHEEKVFRLVETSSDGRVTIKSLESEHTFTVPFTDVAIVEVEGAREDYIAGRRLAWLRQSVNNPKEMKVASERAEAIEFYFDKKLTRPQLMSAIDVSEATLTRLLKKYDPELGAVSLLRSIRGRKAGTKMLDSLHEEIMEEAFNKYFKRKQRVKSVSDIVDYIDSKCAVAGIRSPSVNTIKKRLDEFGERAVYSLLHGREAMAQKFDLKPGMINVETILTMVQIDHTRVDLIIRDEDGEPLTRPWLTVVIDLKSRVILGYYVALHPPSSLSVAMALLSACYPKTEQPLALGGGRETLHRFWGTPKAVGSDNAVEFTSDAFEATLSFYGIELLLRPIGKKHYGGHIERIIGTLMGKVHFLPGTTYSNVLSKADYDSAKNSALTFGQFCQWLADQIAIYHGRAHEGLGRKAPCEVWDEELKKLGAHYVPPIPGDFRTFTLDFFPTAYRTVQVKGIEFKGAFYTSTVLTGLVGKRIAFKYNPLNLSKLWLRIEGRFYEIPYSDITRSPISLSTHWARRNYRRAGALVDRSLHVLRLKAHDDVASAVKQTKKLRQESAKKHEAAELMNTVLADTTVIADYKPLSSNQTRKKLDWKG